jgi:hypothetical protein
MSSNGEIQTAVVYNGQIYRSVDTGLTWTPVDNDRRWVSVAMSSTGLIQTAVEQGGQIYRSVDTGQTWTPVESNREWFSVAMSASGVIQTAVVDGGQIYRSVDTGQIWNPVESDKRWYSVAMSDDGVIQTAVVYDGQIYRSINTGQVWTPVAVIKQWQSVAMSSTGLIQTAVVFNGQIYRSVDTGLSWTPVAVIKQWQSVAMSSTGLIQTAVVNGGQIYRSVDTGLSWTPVDSTRNWISVAMSSTGLIQTAVVNGGQIYRSVDTGLSWTPSDSVRQWYSVAMSSDGLIQTAVVAGDQIYINYFGIDPVELNVNSVVSLNQPVEIRIIFNETPTVSNRYSLLNGFKMNTGYNYTITTYTTSPVQDIYIQPGNYTVESLITQINSQIHEVNPNFYYNGVIQPFTYNVSTKKITFNPHYLGAKDAIIQKTALLTSLGITTIPDNVLGPITGQSNVITTFSGSKNLYIVSDTLGRYMIEKSVAPTSWFTNVIATLNYDPTTDAFRIIDSNKSEIYLSQKISLSEIDIRVIDDTSNIVNLNGGNISMNMRLIKS